MNYLDFLIKDYHGYFNSRNIVNINNPTNYPYIEDRKSAELPMDYWNRSDKEIYSGAIIYPIQPDRFDSTRPDKITHIDGYEGIKVKNADDILKSFLESKVRYGPQKTKLLIGAPFGVGKTSLVKKLAYDCAKRRSDYAKEYFPIIIFLRNGLNIEWPERNESLDEFLIRMFPNDNQTRTKIDRPILLIFDGLDEYHETGSSAIQLVNSKIPEILKSFLNVKIIYTTRLNKEFEDLGITKKYLRILPFDPAQVDSYLALRNSELTYSALIGYHLEEEEITKPLILSMLVVVLPRLDKDLERLSKYNKLNSNLSRTLIYMNLFYEIFLGKINKEDKERAKKQKQISFYEEKKILRTASFFKKVKNDVTLGEIENWSSNTLDLKMPFKINPETLEPVLSTYFSVKNIGSKSKKSDMKVNFLHKTYEEFFLAEHLLESYLNENPYLLNVGNPSEVTINFLHGFLDLLSADKETVEKYVLNDSDTDSRSFRSLSLFYSVGYDDTSNDQLSSAIDKITATAKNSFFSKNIVTVNIRENKNGKNENDPANNDNKKWFYLTENLDSEVNKYENLLVNKFVSLIVINKLNRELFKQLDIHGLIRKGSNFLSPYLRFFPHANLPNVDLSYLDLSNANLSNANLNNTNLHHTDLSNTDLSNTDLSNAKLMDSNLSNANLSNANLSNANLSNADVSYTNMTNAILANVEAYHSLLDGAELTNATLTNTNLRFALNLPISKEDAKARGAKVRDTQ